MPGIQKFQLPPHHQAFVERFVQVCQADDRVVASFLGGSNVKGTADEYSDVDLTVITTDASYEEFYNQRRQFLESLGGLVFLENFEIPEIAFYIFADGTDGELNFACESRMDHLQPGSFHVLLDKKNVLSGIEFPEKQPYVSDQTEKLRRNLYGFWHEMSHFTTAIGRGQLWWAGGQLEALRSICVNLARLQNDFSDKGVGEEPYFKIENAMPVEKLASLKTTFCPMERNAMLQSAQVIIQFYAQVGQLLAQAHGIPYPHRLESLMLDHFKKLSKRATT